MLTDLGLRLADRLEATADLLRWLAAALRATP